MDFSTFLLDENYWKDTLHYQLNDKDFKISVAQSPKNLQGYSTALNLSSPIVKQSDLMIRLLMQIPAWVEAMNDDSALEFTAFSFVFKWGSSNCKHSSVL